VPRSLSWPTAEPVPSRSSEQIAKPSDVDQSIPAPDSIIVRRPRGTTGWCGAMEALRHGRDLGADVLSVSIATRCCPARIVDISATLNPASAVSQSALFDL